MPGIVEKLKSYVIKRPFSFRSRVRVRERLCRREFFYNAFRALSFNGIGGDYAEFGCHKGCRCSRRTANGHSSHTCSMAGTASRSSSKARRLPGRVADPAIGGGGAEGAGGRGAFDQDPLLGPFRRPAGSRHRHAEGSRGGRSGPEARRGLGTADRLVRRS